MAYNFKCPLCGRVYLYYRDKVTWNDAVTFHILGFHKDHVEAEVKAREKGAYPGKIKLAVAAEIKQKGTLDATPVIKTTEEAKKELRTKYPLGVTVL